VYFGLVAVLAGWLGLKLSKALAALIGWCQLKVSG
jgi:hypothetical protein